ncbi:MAG: ABC transporter substrate-binding protein [Alicyclobacillaceae bacterium]|nr:ABC transporter substrate-binding protein [Alicyclobacillaceae bacterium]
MFGKWVVAGLASLSLAACGSQAQPTGGSAQGGGPQGDTITIGWTGPLSGGAALYGQNTLNGLKMAVDEINANGGVNVNGKKYKLDVVSLDDKYLPNEAATNAKRLVQQYHAPVVFCPHSGGILAIQGFNAKQEPNFIIGAYSSEPQILKQNNPLTLMLPPRYDAYFKPFADTVMQKFGKKLGLVPGTHAYAKAWTEGFTKVWKESGGEVLSNNAVDYNTTTDFSAAVSKALAEKPDVLFVGGASQPTALVIKAAREQGFKGGFVVMDQAKFEEMSKIVPMSMLEGAVGVLPLSEYPGPGTKDFVAAFKKKFGEDKTPTSEHAFNYMAVHVLARAMELAGTATDVKAIMAKVDEAAKSLPKQVQAYAVTGVTKEGHLEGPLVAAFIQGGKYMTVNIPQIQ